jgi:hypothetical protein
MNDLIRKRDIDYISAPIAPVLKGENVHYEYVAFRKQIEDISPVPAIPIPDNATNGDVIKALFPRIKIKKYPTFLRVIEGEEYIPMTYDWWNSPYKRGETE